MQASAASEKLEVGDAKGLTSKSRGGLPTHGSPSMIVRRQHLWDQTGDLSNGAPQGDGTTRKKIVVCDHILRYD